MTFETSATFTNARSPANIATPAPSKDAEPLQPGRLWSFADMINCSVSSLCALASQLRLMELLMDQPKLDGPAPEAIISRHWIEQTKGWMQVAATVATDFEIQALHDRIAILTKRLKFNISYRELAHELRVMTETLDFGLKSHLIYRYPAQKAEILQSWQGDWEAALRSFPSAAGDIAASVDLWALNHPTAAVFHLMRVLEHGIRALALDLGKRFDIQNWQNILDEIESEIRSQSKNAAQRQREK